jgi:hypothetical protein
MLRLIALALLCTAPLAAQPAQEVVFEWQEYGRQAQCTLRLLPDLHAGEDRPHVAVVTERADNAGPTVVDDLRYLAEQIGRTYGLDPAEVTWLVRWGARAHPGAEGDKEVFLQARFRRTASGALSTPSWRVLSREQAEEVTLRHL